VRSAHRPEVDGLRALAVLPVMLFHAGLGLFPGGYVGVDVFFVISGFLITTIIVNERLAGTFSILQFYERRARRILPALFFMGAVTLPLAWKYMLPAELDAFGRSLMSVATFVSNVFFWRSSGYFDAAAEVSPLLHTWSLGVEEQYYLVFPLLVLALWRPDRVRLWIAIALVTVVSLLGSQWLLKDRQLAAFFLSPARAWELLAGSMLAMACSQGFRPLALDLRLREWLGLAGVALIVGPMVFYGVDTRFPGFSAVPPVLGTVLIIAFVTPDTWVGRLLTLRPVLWVGLISYSAYLWHQPVLAFGRLMHTGALAPAASVGLVALALVLAHVSWRWVEAPFRDRSRWSRKQIFWASGAGTAALFAAGLFLALSKGAPQRWSEASQPFIRPAKTSITGCPAVNEQLNVCRLGVPGVAPTMVLVGDSHAYAIGDALDQQLRSKGRAGLLVHTPCHPIPGLFDSREELTPARVAFCAEANRRVIAEVENPAIESVWVAIRWTARLYPMGSDIDAPEFDNGEGGHELDYPFRKNLAFDGTRFTEAPGPKAGALAGYIERLAALKPTVVMYPVPEAGWTPSRVNLLALASGGELPVVSTSSERFLARNAAALRVLDSVSSPNLSRSKPSALLCDTFLQGRCAIQANGQLFYADDDHLSATGARLVVGDMAARSWDRR